MDIQATAQKVLEEMSVWQQTDRLIVGLDGYSGIGKTTLSNNISRIAPSIQVLSMDSVVTTANDKEHLLPQINNHVQTLSLEWKPVDGIARFRRKIRDFKEGKDIRGILLVEGVFLYHPDLLDDLWDKRIYLDGDFEKADVRRQNRERARWGKSYISEDHPDSYARLFKIAYRRYCELYKPEERSDLLLRLDIS